MPRPVAAAAALVVPALPAAAGAPCGETVWCRADVRCSFEQLPVTHAGGTTYTVPYYSSVGDIAAPRGAAAEEAELALVVSHGAVPDPGGYFCAGMDAAARQQGVAPSRVAVVAPWYLGSGASTPPTATQLQWTSSAHRPVGGDWRDGADSDPAGGRPGDVSSYRVLDIILTLFLHHRSFPRLRGVVMWGDSAGGQVLARYALATHLPTATLRHVRVLPSNPSSFPYPSPLRWNYSYAGGECVLGALARPDAAAEAACPGYDAWRYGVGGNLPPYVAAGLARRGGGAARLPSVAVTYLQGTLDTCNEDGACGTERCASGGLDRGCAALLQGPMRLWRGRRYKAALDAHYGQDTHSLVEVQGVGHDAYDMARSPEFLAAAFGAWPTEQRANASEPE